MSNNEKISIKSAEDIEKLREGGKHLAQILTALEKMVAPGVTTYELDQHAESLTRELSDIPVLKGYKPDFANRPYPATTCISINDEVVHGIPSKERVLVEGDIVSIDMSIGHDGMIVDSARTIPVGKISDEAQKLINVTREARGVGIKAARVGNHIGDIGHAIEQLVKPHGYGIVRDLCGHGVGYEVHEPPHIFNFGKPGTGEELKPGMVLALEPMINMEGERVVFERDGYTVRTKDGSLSAHFEHTIVITEGEAEILT